MWFVCNGLPLQMAVSQPHEVDLCFSSEEDESSVEEVDSSYDSILVLSQSDDPLPQVPWRFGKAARNDNVGFNNFLNQIILMYLMFCIYLCLRRWKTTTTRWLFCLMFAHWNLMSLTCRKVQTFLTGKMRQKIFCLWQTRTYQWLVKTGNKCQENQKWRWRRGLGNIWVVRRKWPMVNATRPACYLSKRRTHWRTYFKWD